MIPTHKNDATLRSVGRTLPGEQAAELDASIIAQIAFEKRMLRDLFVFEDEVSQIDPSLGELARLLTNGIARHIGTLERRVEL